MQKLIEALEKEYPLEKQGPYMNDLGSVCRCTSGNIVMTGHELASRIVKARMEADRLLEAADNMARILSTGLK